MKASDVSRDRYLSRMLILLLLGILPLIALRIPQRENTIDDAYITYRYARNLAEGNGFRYNPGSERPVLGTTTPFYTLLLAGLARLFRTGNFPFLSFTVNLLFDLANYFLLFALIKRLTKRTGLAVLCAWLYAINDWLIEFSTAGMETPVYICFILATLCLLLGRRFVWAMVLAGLTLFTRPDALILIVASGIWMIWDILPLPWEKDSESSLSKGVLLKRVCLPVIPLLMVVPWAVYALHTFGSFIPHSIQAKGSGVYHIHPLQGFWLFFIQFPSYLFPLGHVSNYLPDRIVLIYWLSILLLPFLWFARKGSRRGRDFDLLSIFFGLYIGAFMVGNPILLGWYRAPVETFYIAVFAVGGFWAIEWISDRLRISRSPIQKGFVLFLIASQAIQYGFFYRNLSLTLYSEAPFQYQTYWKGKERGYRLLAEYLANRIAPEAIVASSEIGALGYYLPNRILDLVGLVSPEVMKYYPYDGPTEGMYGTPPRLLAELKPDYLVTMREFISPGCINDPQFQNLYERVDPLPKGIGETGIRLYRLR